MIITVGQVWEVLGSYPDGRQIKAVDVFNERRLIGRLVDLGNGAFRADYVNIEGELHEDVLPGYYEALTRVAEEAQLRHGTLH